MISKIYSITYTAIRYLSQCYIYVRSKKTFIPPTFVANKVLYNYYKCLCFKSIRVERYKKYIFSFRQLNVNPDNIATPIAASLGDVTTLGLLAWIADILYRHLQEGLFTSHIIIGIVFYFIINITVTKLTSKIYI